MTTRNNNSIIKGNDRNAVFSVLDRLLNGRTFTKEQMLFGAIQSRKGRSPAAQLVHMGVVGPNDVAWCWEKRFTRDGASYNKQLGMAIRVNGKVHMFDLTKKVDKDTMDFFLRGLIRDADMEDLKQREIERRNQASLNSALNKKSARLDDNDLPF